ncbi:MAG TPA: RHS repeat-associated core domain-containing protein [Polyangia bacterium]
MNGACVGSNPIVCAASDACHAPGTCVPVDATWTCEPSSTVLPNCSLGAFDYDRVGRLIRDRQAELHYDPYDQLREVVPIAASPPPLTNLPVEDLQTSDEFQASAGRSNAAGDVPVAVVVASSFATHTFLFEGVGVEDLNATLGMSGLLQGNAIGDSKAVAGSWLTQDFASHAFRYDASGFHDLITGDSTVAYDVNAANEVVGVFSASGHLHGFVHTDASGFQPIGTLGGANSWAWAIDNDGVVSASAQLAGAPPSGFGQYGHAVLYDAVSGLRDLNNIVDIYAALTLVVANQKRGDWVVGGALDPYGVERAYRIRLSSGAVDNLGWGGSSSATAVNDAGDAVGWAYLESTNTTQVAWILTARTGLAKLNDLIDPASGWNLQTATGIDALGDVVGAGTHNGRQSAFRLRIPAHSTGTGGPALAEVHTYGYDGLRTSTTTAPGTGSASTQVWFTQDYTERNGIREHYVRIGDRLVAKLTTQSTGSGAMGTVATAPSRNAPAPGRESLRYALASALMFAAFAGLFFGYAKRRRRWVPARAGFAALLFGAASCSVFGSDSNRRALDWSTAPSLTRFFHRGISAGPTLITDSAGALVEERRHEPFGQPIPTVDVVAEPQNILGKLTDPNTGWSYHGARWMQPQTARWTAPDPAVQGPNGKGVGAPWKLNPYAYVGQSPAMYWDPDGRDLALIDVQGEAGSAERLRNVVNKDLSVTDLRIGEDHKVSLERTAEGPMTQKEQAFADAIDPVLKDKTKTITLGVTAGERFRFDDFLSHRIDAKDYEDVLARDKPRKGMPDGVPSAAATFVHGVKEQEWGYNVLGDPRKKAWSQADAGEYYWPAHVQGLNEEAKIDGMTRVGNDDKGFGGIHQEYYDDWGTKRTFEYRELEGGELAPVQ